MTTTWIYHERQQALLCGQHALNNLLQIQSFTPDSLAEIALQLGKTRKTQGDCFIHHYPAKHYYSKEKSGASRVVVLFDRRSFSRHILSTLL